MRPADRVRVVDVRGYGAPEPDRLWEPGRFTLFARGEEERGLVFYRDAAPPMTECTGAIRIEYPMGASRVNQQGRAHLHGPPPAEGHTLLSIVRGRTRAGDMKLVEYILVPDDQVETVMEWLGPPR